MKKPLRCLSLKQPWPSKSVSKRSGFWLPSTPGTFSLSFLSIHMPPDMCVWERSVAAMKSPGKLLENDNWIGLKLPQTWTVTMKLPLTATELQAEGNEGQRSHGSLQWQRPKILRTGKPGGHSLLSPVGHHPCLWRTLVDSLEMSPLKQRVNSIIIISGGKNPTPILSKGWNYYLEYSTSEPHIHPWQISQIKETCCRIIIYEIWSLKMCQVKLCCLWAHPHVVEYKICGKLKLLGLGVSSQWRAGPGEPELGKFWNLGEFDKEDQSWGAPSTASFLS